MNKNDNDKNPSASESQKSQSGLTPTEARKEITEIYQNTRNWVEFVAALEERGFVLSHSTRRDVFVIDRQGGEHNLLSRIVAPSEEVEKKLAGLDPTAFPLKKSRKLDNFVKCILSTKEKAKVKSRADRAGLSMSSYLRELIFGKDTPQPRAARRPPVEKEELIKLRFELRKIGGNLNQLANAQNPEKIMDNSALTALCAEHSTVLKAIMAALGKELTE